MTYLPTQGVPYVLCENIHTGKLCIICHSVRLLGTICKAVLLAISDFSHGSTLIRHPKDVITNHHNLNKECETAPTLAISSPSIFFIFCIEIKYFFNATSTNQYYQLGIFISYISC